MGNRCGESADEGNDEDGREGFDPFRVAQRRDGGRSGRGVAKPEETVDAEDDQTKPGTEILEDFVHVPAIRVHSEDFHAEERNRFDAGRAGVGERVPGEVGQRAEDEGDCHGQPCNAGQARCPDDLTQAATDPLREETEKRMFEEQVKGQVGGESDREAEPEDSPKAVTLESSHAEGQEEGEVRCHAPDDERRGNGPITQKAREREYGGGMGEGEGHGWKTIFCEEPFHRFKTIVG